MLCLTVITCTIQYLQHNKGTKSTFDPPQVAVEEYIKLYKYVFSISRGVGHVGYITWARSP